MAAYAAEKSLREHLHGKMTVIFLGNLTICFIVAALSWFQVNRPKEWNVLYSTWFVHNNLSQVAEVDSGGCVLSGYLIQVLVLEAKIFICLSYLVFESKDIHMLILSLPSPVFLPRILLLPQRHCHQHLFAVQHDLSNFSKGSAESKHLNISWGPCECVCGEKWSLSQAVSRNKKIEENHIRNFLLAPRCCF